MPIPFDQFYGVDFSGAKKAGDNTWVARLVPTGRRRGPAFALTDPTRLTALAGTADRTPALRHLVELVLASDAALWGFDFPFGLPVELFPHGSRWADQFAFLADWGDEAYACGLDCVRRARLVGDRMHIRRATDTAAKAPFDYYHYRKVHQPLPHSVNSGFSPDFTAYTACCTFRATIPLKAIGAAEDRAMPRKPGVWWREAVGCYYTTIGGEKKRLSPDKKEAEKLFHQLMAAKAEEEAGAVPEPPKGLGPTFKKLADLYLIATKDDKMERAFQWQVTTLNSFCASLKKGTLAKDVRPHQAEGWLRTKTTWGDGTKANARKVLKAVCNWAVAMGHLDVSPLKKLKRKDGKARDRVMSPDELKAIYAFLEG